MTPLRYLLRRRGRKHTGPGRAQGAPRGAPAAEVVGRQRQRLRAWQLHILVFLVLIYLIPTSKMHFYKKKKRLERSDEVSLKIVVTCSLII